MNNNWRGSGEAVFTFYSPQLGRKQDWFCSAFPASVSWLQSRRVGAGGGWREDRGRTEGGRREDGGRMEARWLLGPTRTLCSASDLPSWPGLSRNSAWRSGSCGLCLRRSSRERLGGEDLHMESVNPPHWTQQQLDRLKNQEMKCTFLKQRGLKAPEEVDTLCLHLWPTSLFSSSCFMMLWWTGWFPGELRNSHLPKPGASSQLRRSLKGQPFQ